jgi:hypothetical protein
MQARGERWRDVAGAAVAIGISAAVLWPVLAYPFQYDELIHLYTLANFGPLELLLTPHGGHLLFASNWVYAPLYALFGMWAPAYAALALATHLLNVGLAWAVLRRLGGRRGLATVAAALWGSAALHVGSVGWFAVYGQILLTTAVLWILLDAARVMGDGGRPMAAMRVRWAVLLVVAAGSFGFGLALAALLPAALYLMLEPRPRWRVAVGRLLLAAVAVAALYGAMQWLHGAVSNRPPLHGVATAGQRTPRLADAPLAAGLFADYVAAGVAELAVGPGLRVEPTSLLAARTRPAPTPRVALASRLVALAWFAAFAVCLARRPRPQARQALTLAALGLSGYAMLALWAVSSGRIDQLVELAEISGRDLAAGIWDSQVAAPRYHYLPPLLLLLATVRALPPPAAGARARSGCRAIAALAAGWAAVVLATDGLAVRGHRPGWAPVRLVERQLRRAVAATPPGETLRLDNDPVPIPFAGRDATLPGRAAVALLLFPDGQVDGRRVVFVERDPALLAALRAAPPRPIASLVEGP